MSRPIKHIWLLLLPGQVHGWEIVRGVCRFAKNRRWLLTIMNPRVAPTATDLRKSRVDGMIGLIYHPRYLELMRKLNVPAVNLTRGSQVGRIPSVLVDDYACGRLAAEYFLSRGFENFGYLGAVPLFPSSESTAPSPSYAAERQRGFHETLVASGRTYHWVELDQHLATRRDDVIAGRRIGRRRLAWLRELPKPIAIFTAYDPVALDLVHGCQLAGVRVPEEVSVLGVHNGQILCEMSTPPLSSIDTASEQRGYLAARLLDEQFEGSVNPAKVIVLPPVGVVSRSSTDFIATRNPLVAEALQFIRDHLSQGIGVADVVRHCVVSRRQLERVFRTTLGRTPLQEIHRLRVELARDLLATTTLGMSAVAERAGYTRADRMAKAIREATGRTPRAYRAVFADR